MYVYEVGLSSVDAPTIVLIHGAVISGWMWEPQIKHLEHEFHLLIPDLPEHGRSVNGSPFSIDNSADQIVEIIQAQAHGGRAHIVGLSVGATVALEILMTAPQLVDHVVLSSASVGPFPGAFLLGLTKYLTVPFLKSSPGIKQLESSLGVPSEYRTQLKASVQGLSAGLFGRVNRDVHEFEPVDRLG
ncbi:MAG TPA: alpha/beta fold hydrolase, partial [Aggregatilineales bacterium]|nr:alpha/beta fold hydrolase [Aggregatilineales bacterium]